MHFKKILMAKGQQLHSKPANTSRQISKTKTKNTHKPQTGNLQKENCSICLLQFEVDIKGMNGPVMVYLKIPPSSYALSFCGQCHLYKHILFRILQLVMKLTWPSSDRRVLLSVKVCSAYRLTWHQNVLPLDTVHWRPSDELCMRSQKFMARMFWLSKTSLQYTSLYKHFKGCLLGKSASHNE